MFIKNNIFDGIGLEQVYCRHSSGEVPSVWMRLHCIGWVIFLLNGNKLIDQIYVGCRWFLVYNWIKNWSCSLCGMAVIDLCYRTMQVIGIVHRVSYFIDSRGTSYSCISLIVVMQLCVTSKFITEIQFTKQASQDVVSLQTRIGTV